MKPNVPDVVVRRLTLYHRALEHLQRMGVRIIRSEDLARETQVAASQVRKDLSYFGEFGRQGRGYDVDVLCRALREILGMDRIWDMILVGVGRLGQALARYTEFPQEGFRLVALFDVDPKKIGTRIGDLEILPLEALQTFLRAHPVEIAILAVPPGAAQEVTDLLVEAGITAILNYAPVVLTVPPHVHVRNVDPVAALQSMTYYLK